MLVHSPTDFAVPRRRQAVTRVMKRSALRCSERGRLRDAGAHYSPARLPARGDCRVRAVKGDLHCSAARRNEAQHRSGRAASRCCGRTGAGARRVLDARAERRPSQGSYDMAAEVGRQGDRQLARRVQCRYCQQRRERRSSNRAPLERAGACASPSGDRRELRCVRTNTGAPRVSLHSLTAALAAAGDRDRS